MKLTEQEEIVLKQDSQIWAMAETDGFKQVLRPWLEQKMNQSFPDPSEFKKQEEFTYAALTASCFKKVIAEFLRFIDEKITEAKFLDDKRRKRTEKDPFAIGQ